MQTFIYGLLLAAVSATTVVAFKHPNGYSKLFPYLLGIATLLFAGISLWHVAVEVTWSNLVGFLTQQAIADAEMIKASLSFPYVWVAFWYSGVVAFLWVNLKLPPFLHTADEGGAVGEEKKSR